MNTDKFCWGVSVLAVSVLFVVYGAIELARSYHGGTPPLDPHVRTEIAAEPSLFAKIATALREDHDGWDHDGYRIVWRGKVCLWIANGPDFLGTEPKNCDGTGAESPDFAGPDHALDRMVVWKAYEYWLTQEESHGLTTNEKLFNEMQ